MKERLNGGPYACFIMKIYIHVDLGKSSTMVRNKLEPSSAETEKRPHKSHCIRSNIQSETVSLDKNDRHLCLANGQIVHTESKSL